jgi:hypothetical protein
MASEPKVITDEEFASLLAVGRCSMLQPPAVIPGEHRAQLIWLGYVADIGGRLRTTTSGRRRIAAEFFKNMSVLAEKRGDPVINVDEYKVEHTRAEPGLIK